MRIKEEINASEIRNRYSKIVAWGTGPIFTTNFRRSEYNIDYLIDGTEKHVGEEVIGYKVYGKNILKDIDEKVLVVIFTIYEKQVIEEIEKINPRIDYLLYTNIRTTERCEIFAKSAEDALVKHLVHQECLSSMRLMEIGVCHPILRNNTYGLYKEYSNKEGYKGLLVEPNPSCWSLIEQYREKDLLLRNGISSEGGVARFYCFPNFLGHSTFSSDIATKLIKEGRECETYDIEMLNINNVILEYFKGEVDVLSIDAEGMDSLIIDAIDFDKISIKIIICENFFDEEKVINEKLVSYGYYQYAQTLENAIWTKSKLGGYFE